MFDCVELKNEPKYDKAQLVTALEAYLALGIKSGCSWFSIGDWAFETLLWHIKQLEKESN